MSTTTSRQQANYAADAAAFDAAHPDLAESTEQGEPTAPGTDETPSVESTEQGEPTPETPSPEVVPAPALVTEPAYRCNTCLIDFTKSEAADGNIRCPKCRKIGSRIDPKTGAPKTDAYHWINLQMPRSMYDEMDVLAKALVNAEGKPKTYSPKTMACDIWPSVWAMLKPQIEAEVEKAQAALLARPETPADLPKEPKTPKVKEPKAEKAPKIKATPAPKTKAPKVSGKDALAALRAEADARKAAEDAVNAEIDAKRAAGSETPAHDLLAKELVHVGPKAPARARGKRTPDSSLPTPNLDDAPVLDFDNAPTVEVIEPEVRDLVGEAATVLAGKVRDAQREANVTRAIMLVYLKGGAYKITKTPAQGSGQGVLILKVSPMTSTSASQTESE